MTQNSEHALAKVSSSKGVQFYTYAHYRPDNRVFYIGKGKGRRLNDVNRGAHWKSVVTKDGGFRAEVLAYWPTEEEAFTHEKFLISCFRELGHPLVNLTDGGDGPAGWVPSDETRKRMSIAFSGRKYSDATKAKQRVATAASWGDPEIRTKRALGIKQAHSRPEVKVKKAASAIAALLKPGARERIRAAALKVWADPNLRARHSVIIKNAHASPEARAKISANTKLALASPEVRARMSASITAAQSSAEYRARMSVAVKAAIAAKKNPQPQMLKGALNEQ